MQHREAFQDVRVIYPHSISPVTLSTPEAISIVIPTLNEAENIGHLLIRLHQALTEAAISYEVIVVDDHSSDDTVAIARAIAKEKDLPVQVLTKKGRPGKSYSLIEGFATARFAILAMIDGDLQYPPEALPLMVQASRHADMVVADRRATYREADCIRGRLSRIFTYLMSMLFAIDTDMQSGLKVFRREIYDNGARSCSGKWNLDLYLVTYTVLHGHPLANVPIEFHERQAGESKVHPLKVGLELLWTALQLKMGIIFSAILKESVVRTEKVRTTYEEKSESVR